MALLWDIEEAILARCRDTLGARLRDPHHLESAVAAYRDALGVFRLAGEVRYAVLAERNLERAQGLLGESRSAAE